MPAQRIKGYIEDMITNLNLSKGLRILDTGAGWEPNLYESLFKGSTYLKQDIRRYPNSRLDYICDICKLTEVLPTESFDLVINAESLERIYSPQVAINSIWNILKFDGILIVTTNFYYPYRPCKTNTQMKDFWRFTPRGLLYMLRNFDILDLTVEGNPRTPRGIWATARKVRQRNRNLKFRFDAIPIKPRIVPLNYIGWQESKRKRKR